MILVINVAKEKLHYFEFVKPIEDILEKNYFTRHYLDLTCDDLDKSDKVIICGTGLKDNFFLENLDKFSWLKDFKKPVLGICAGFQIIGMIFGGKIFKKLEIGYFYENFDKEFLGFKGRFQVYHLHNNYLKFSDDFEVYSFGEIAQAVKYKGKEIYGTLFHPEVRNKDLIRNYFLLK